PRAPPPPARGPPPPPPPHFLIDQNRAFHKHLESLHIPHEYEEFPGEHNWAYWDQHVQEAIAFHVKNLKLKS
ncbi:MAG: hypothetical protein IRY99_15255, partial [Isosphaeraceae bacterium]|nr:hypothetical protein [Isosphaeraceae bacterium]